MTTSADRAILIAQTEMLALLDDAQDAEDRDRLDRAHALRAKAAVVRAELDALVAARKAEMAAEVAPAPALPSSEPAMTSTHAVTSITYSYDTEKLGGASPDLFETHLERLIERYYPGAELEIERGGADHVVVLPLECDGEAREIKELAQDAWESACGES